MAQFLGESGVNPDTCGRANSIWIRCDLITCGRVYFRIRWHIQCKRKHGEVRTRIWTSQHYGRSGSPDSWSLPNKTKVPNTRAESKKTKTCMGLRNLSTKERTQWTGEAWRELSSDKMFAEKLFMKSGYLMTADGSDDDMIKPQGLEPYRF